jgi:hypothetical protein
LISVQKKKLKVCFFSKIELKTKLKLITIFYQNLSKAYFPMSALEIITTAKVVRQVFDVYNMCDAKDVCTKKQFQKDTWYYQTYGGGPEGGFFVKEAINQDTGESYVVGVWSVHRTWHQPFNVRKTSWTDAEYEIGRAMETPNQLVLQKLKKPYKPRTKKVKSNTLDQVLQVPVKDKPEEEVLEFKDENGNIKIKMSPREWLNVDDAGTEVLLQAVDKKGGIYRYYVNQDDLERM